MNKIIFASNESNHRHLSPLALKSNIDFCSGPSCSKVLRGKIVIVAAVGDEHIAMRNGAAGTILCEHGAGQSYIDLDLHEISSWNGGRGKPENRLLFLAPNEFSANRHKQFHPNIPSVAVGSFFLDRWNGYEHKRKTQKPTVAISTHWNCRIVSETRSAWPWVREKIKELANSNYFTLVGHCHPFEKKLGTYDQRMKDYHDAGIKVLETWEEVMNTADCYIADNTSTIYEFAATGRPVVVLNPPWYRKDRHHGLRFWDAIPGIEVDHLEIMEDSIRMALDDPDFLVKKRINALQKAYYGLNGGAVDRAIAEIANI